MRWIWVGNLGVFLFRGLDYHIGLPETDYTVSQGRPPPPALYETDYTMYARSPHPRSTKVNHQSESYT